MSSSEPSHSADPSPYAFAPPPLPGEPDGAIPIVRVDRETWPARAATLVPMARAFLEASEFEPKAGRIALVPAPDGSVAEVLFGVGSDDDPFAAGKLAAELPAGTYRFADEWPDLEGAALAWLLAGYRFDRYRERPRRAARLVAPKDVDAGEIERIAEAVALGRDLINTPANDLGPDEVEAAARRIADRFGAEFSVIAGDALLAANLPMIHAVGAGSPRAPRLIDMVWGERTAPMVTIVGKGVCFDTGGLDIKPSAAMLLMKKDMGGAAAALALAQMIMGADLPIRLRVLIPTVENAISGASFRPGDVMRSRKGLSVEIGNTDAEGRLILADALALADEEEPGLIVDFATLTGAARVALGPDLPPVYSDDDALAEDVVRLGLAVNDPVWRLPLWPRYRSMIEGKVADLTNAPAGGFAGSITAALFLARFVTAAKAHLHFDIYGWMPSSRPARPEGGEVQGARLVYALLKERYSA
ncbi:leucyl aminopeptidase family protein [Enterovirga rhinocerotis]|uniref:Leucyl aminopeptidase n=1 Tax=Enterovirga rhinocerotis TaxID=1339210 RepID=A0A4R7C7X4_9HYPH|nr:leucyl aminopeptidase family protein [Enterovirga rhinocerotis]TDR94734.1 leucyl aminopeptidase [Enterovirga rhinocerotis]